VADALLVRARETNKDVVIAGPENALAFALSEMEPGAIRWSPAADSAETPDASQIVIHTGEAEVAANDLVRWRRSGWNGPLIGGPDMAQPWFGDLAGAYAEGIAALVCGRSSDSDDPTNTGDMYQQAAREAAEAALDAIASAIAETGSPSRSAVAQALTQSPPEAQTHWYRYSTGSWLYDAEASVSPGPAARAD
jgi:ABC-type branched-subunit amino acid transport system substrate-binding protein